MTMLGKFISFWRIIKKKLMHEQVSLQKLCCTVSQVCLFLDSCQQPIETRVIGIEDSYLQSGVIKFRINQDFLIEHSCILGMRS